MHYTDTIDYIVVTNGQFQLLTHDGTSRTVNVGDFVTQLANLHQWNNKTDQWARTFRLSSTLFRAF